MKLWNVPSLSAAPCSLYFTACKALFPHLSFSCSITICCSNKIARHVISLSSCFRVGFAYGPEKQRACRLPFSLPVLCLRDSGGESLPCLCVRGALSTLCKHTLLLEAGLPVTSRSLLTEDQLRHFLSKLAERLPVHKNKSTHKTPSLGLYS